MPKTPPHTIPPPLPVAAAAPRTPPPIPQTPAPRPTMVGAAGTPPPIPPIPTPRPHPTMFGAAGAAGTSGPWAGATPPPMAPPTVFAPAGTPPKRKRRRWLWVLAAVVIFSFLRRDKPASHRSEPEPSPAAAADSVDSEARAVRDDEIQTRLERALRSNPRTRRQDIDVEVDEGTVTLSGHATAAVSRDAEAMARRIDGVQNVVNTIEVEEAEKPREPAGVPGLEGLPGVEGLPPGVPRPPLPGLPLPPETMEMLLKNGREALKEEDPGAALGNFGAALGLDPKNEEAKNGMKAAMDMFKAQAKKREDEAKRLQHND
jgi:hypothetical protein